MHNLQHLSSQDYRTIFDNTIDGQLSDDQIKTFLLKLNQIDYPTNAFIGAIQSFKPRCKNIVAPNNALDVCGTGGDCLNTLNISTAVALVVAGCGVPVAKHGNRAISSKVGSADVLSELGINIMKDKPEIENSIKSNNLCFMFAPLYHNSFKALAKIRSELAVPTIFNFLGPLLNPANTKYQLIGTSQRSTMLPMLQALNSTGSKKVFIVHGLDNMDEITITDNSVLIRLENGVIFQPEIINPEDYGIRKSPLSTIKGGDAKYNANKIIDLLNSEESPYLDIVALNTAFALMVASKVKSITDGIRMAKQAIKSGKAREILQQYQNRIIAI